MRAVQPSAVQFRSRACVCHRTQSEILRNVARSCLGWQQFCRHRNRVYAVPVLCGAGHSANHRQRIRQQQGNDSFNKFSHRATGLGAVQIGFVRAGPIHSGAGVIGDGKYRETSIKFRRHGYVSRSSPPTPGSLWLRQRYSYWHLARRRRAKLCVQDRPAGRGFAIVSLA